MASPLSGRRVLVTGATGFLGTHLARALVAAGAQVHALRRDPESSTRLPCVGIEWHLGDLMDIESLERAVRESRPDVVFHLAASGTTMDERDEATAFHVNVEGSLNLWRALSSHPSRFVHTGSCGEYGQVRGRVAEDQACAPTWFYPATKSASVVLLSTLSRESGRECVILRPFGPYGPADNSPRIVPQVIRALLRGDPVRVTRGEQLRDYAFVDDQIEAFLLAATVPLRANGVVYNVGSGRIVTLRQLIEIIADAVGGGALERIEFGAIPYRESEVWEMCANIDAARTELGYKPLVSLEDGIQRTVAWYREAEERG